MYREVAEEPFNEFHFETGRKLAERLGYPSDAKETEMGTTERALDTQELEQPSGRARSLTLASQVFK